MILFTRCDATGFLPFSLGSFDKFPFFLRQIPAAFSFLFISIAVRVRRRIIVSCWKLFYFLFSFIKPF